MIEENNNYEELNEIKTTSQNNNQQELVEIANQPINNAPQEKILHLQKGSKVWKKICIVFGISMGLLAIFLPISIIVSPICFIFVGIGGIGLIYSFVYVTCCNGFIIINKNEAVVYQYFGKYLGTVKENGYFYGYPLAKTTRISLRSNQYNGDRFKVNERDGNPVELGIIVVWRIGDTAKAIYNVMAYERFIHTQSEAAIRYIGCKYPYDPIAPGEISLRSGHEIINKELKKELSKRVYISGLIIEDARVTEISYGKEVAKMMLQKQASNATVYAKDAIVKGAVSAVINSLNEFEKKGYKFTNDEKSKYAAKMMTTLCMSSEVSKIMGS